MIDSQLLSILRCPRTRTPLRRSTTQELDRVNWAIAHGELVNRLGTRLERALDEGLVNQDASLMYAVYDGIPQMISDEAIPLDQVALALEAAPAEDS